VTKASTRILIMIIILAFAAMACIGGGGGGDGDQAGSNNSVLSPAQSNTHSPDATATYGAQQLHIQLTEIARPDD
jgi:hypothetical protein